jgi:16S rRNA (uracil1498-N3)-methyltransferase
MHRCFVSPAAWKNSEISLTQEEEHHLLDVLRAQAGDSVILFDGQGRQAEALLIPPPSCENERKNRSGPRILARIVESRGTIRPAVSITLIQALAKGQRMDWIVEKSTELGVSVIVPVVTERVVTHLKERQKDERRDRWQRIALSAAKQCQTNWVPEIGPVCCFSEAVQSCSKMDLFLVGSLAPDARLLRIVLEERRRKKPRNVALLIGPEGDLTPDELEEARRTGAVPVSFGSLVLRVETAALFGMSVLASEFLAGTR